jgi:hypothetical protein
MTDDVHGCGRVHPGSAEVGRGAVSQFMEAKVSNTRRLLRSPERPGDLLYRLSLVKKDAVGLEASDLRASANACLTAGVMGTRRGFFVFVSTPRKVIKPL